MKKIYFLALGALISYTHAQLIVSEKIYQQMNARENPRVLMKSQKTTVNQDSYIYTIAGTRDFKSGKNFQVKKLDDFHRFTVNKKNKKKRPLASETEMRTRAMEDIKAILPRDVADSCAITSVGYEYEQRDSNKPRVVGSMIMAHRKLDGIPVRGSSYVLMSYDSTGNLSYMDVQWDKYNKVPAKSTVEQNKRNKIHRVEFDELVESVSQDFKENDLRGSLDNSSQTLTALENEKGEVMLVPSVTFIGQYSTMNSDESIPMTFDIPTDASLVPVNKAIVSR
ncbi:MAG: hypothetical protein Q4E52_06915 [Fibrobacter sp.]|uniref:hypothetical protein n=1 Tax=Fibrobacter sp. UWH5 TaxID=1896211 RepID=UPI000916B0BA|nr:hypothetical protein [Fibrobacter sp. UWH5]MDO4947296.1 hypothetical protein [Fibrobacter sp.]SHK97705.1 hypothetical protein SAMN05720764_10639 [Fibrobacter sp. UWH5]